MPVGGPNVNEVHTKKCVYGIHVSGKYNTIDELQIRKRRNLMGIMGRYSRLDELGFERSSFSS